MKQTVSLPVSLSQVCLLLLAISTLVASGARAAPTTNAVSPADFVQFPPEDASPIGSSMHWIGPCALPPGQSITATFCTAIHEGVMCPSWAQQQLMCFEARTDPDFIKRLMQEKPSCKKGEETTSAYRCVGRRPDGTAALGRCVFTNDSPAQIDCTLHYGYDKNKVPTKVCVYARVGCGATCEVLESPYEDAIGKEPRPDAVGSPPDEVPIQVTR